jgi:hypothetical protein
MYEKGDLVWIPQGTVLHRKWSENDNLFSPISVTAKPQIGVYAGQNKRGYSRVMIDSKIWEIENREIRYFAENKKEVCYG